MPSLRAAMTRPWPAISPPSSSTSTGTVQPHSRMEAAICATCASECVRALRAEGTRRSSAQRWTSSAGQFMPDHPLAPLRGHARAAPLRGWRPLGPDFDPPPPAPKPCPPPPPLLAPKPPQQLLSPILYPFGIEVVMVVISLA